MYKQTIFAALSARIDYRPGGFSPLYSVDTYFIFFYFGALDGGRTRTPLKDKGF